MVLLYLPELALTLLATQRYRDRCTQERTYSVLGLASSNFGVSGLSLLVFGIMRLYSPIDAKKQRNGKPQPRVACLSKVNVTRIGKLSKGAQEHGELAYGLPNPCVTRSSAHW